jgi:hypothetical protein
MANFNGVNATSAATLPRVLVAPAHAFGRTRVIYDEYEATGEAIGSTITMGVEVPKGASVNNIRVMGDALGASSTLALGITGSTAKYIAATSTSSAFFWDFKQGKIDAFGQVLTASEQLFFTTAGGTVTGTIRIWIEYTLD